MAADDDSTDAASDDQRPYYDFRNMNWIAEGKYAAAYHETYRVVHLDADLTRLFPDAAAVNAALRQYLKDHPPQAAPAA